VGKKKSRRGQGNTINGRRTQLEVSGKKHIKGAWCFLGGGQGREKEWDGMKNFGREGRWEKFFCSIETLKSVGKVSRGTNCGNPISSIVLGMRRRESQREADQDHMINL